MNQQQDPVVKDLNSWINRSAGQHQRRVSEGTQQIPHQQTDEEAANLKMWKSTRIGREMLPHVDYSQVGACCTGDCNQGRDCPERESVELSPLAIVVLYLIVAVLLVAALFATAPELFWLVAGVI